ncbi:MAG: hypothetical protein ACP5P1_08455 [Acidimicrobiales bacterium]
MRMVFGSEMVEKVATTADDRVRLRVEAATLRAVAHPGVVRLVSAADGSVCVRRVQGSVLSEVPPQAPQVTAAWAAALCTTLGDLHGVGCMHTAINADHVILDGDGHPVLCGLGNARWPSDPAERDRLARDDRRAVAALIAEHLASDLGGRTGRPGRLGYSRLSQVHHAGDRRAERTLRRMLADGGAGGGRDESWLRDLARRLSEYSRCSQADPAGQPDPADQRDPADTAERPDPAEHARPAGHAPSLGSVEGARGDSGSPDGQAPGSSIAARLSIHPRRRTTSKRRLAAALLAAAATALIAGVTFDSRTSQRSPTEKPSRTVTVIGPSGPLELSPGSAGRLSVTAGRWTCSKVMPALLDLSNGNIWIFPGWPGPGRHYRGSLVAHVAGAVALGSFPSGRGCDILRANTASGTSVVLKIGGSP